MRGVDAALKTPARRRTPAVPARRARRPEEMRRRILDAAIREFSEHGFSGGRIDRISRNAGTVDRMLYYHFGNKDRLFRTVLEHVYEEMVDEQRRFTLDPDDPVASMRDLVAHCWNHYLQHPELVRLVMTENLHNGKHIQKSTRIKKLTLPLVDTTRTLLEVGRSRGLFRDGLDPRDVLLTIMALGFFYMSNRFTLSHWLGVDLVGARERAHWIEHVTAVVLDAVRRR